MKTIIAITALALAGAATTASAMTMDTPANTRVIQQYAPNADLSTLSDREIAVLLMAISSTDGEGETRSYVQSLLRAAN